VSGTTLPNEAFDFTPNKPASATEAKEFDGIAMFEVATLESFHACFQHPYFVSVIEPDEHNLIDKHGFQGGLIASYMGKMVSVNSQGRSLLGEKGEEAKKEWDAFEAERKGKAA
jgi:hypothetical protein